MKPASATRRRKSHAPTPAGLASLGAERLADLLYAAAKADTALMRTLHREMAAAGGDLGAEIDKQIGRIAKGAAWLDARKATALARELAGLLDAVVVRLGQDQPAAALPRLFDLIGLAPGLLARRRDGEQALGELFRGACCSVGGLLARVETPSARSALAEQAYRLYMADDDGVTAGLVGVVAGALHPDGVKALGLLIDADLQAVQSERSAPGSALLQQTWKLTEALSEIADLTGDVDAFMAAQNLRGPRMRDDLAVVVRLLEAGRGEEALAAIAKAKPSPVQPKLGLTELKVDALDLLGRRDEAQALRWTLFQEHRSIDALRAYLKRLPDFDDVEREAKALDQVTAGADALGALGFLVAWPDHRRAATLARSKAASLDGDAYWVLTPAAEALAHKDPLAATLLYRQMIDFALSRARSGRYGHAARHLTDCAGLAKSVTDWQGHPPHQVYIDKLNAEHGRKYSFWNRVSA